MSEFNYDAALVRFVRRREGLSYDPIILSEAWYEPTAGFYSGCDTCGYGASKEPAEFYIFYKSTDGKKGNLTVTVGEEGEYSFAGLMKEILNG